MTEIKMEPKKENDADSVSTMMVQITTDKTGPKLVCPICNKALISLNGYVKHMKKHEPPGGYLCNYCDERFCLADHLEKHKDEKHKTLACQICHETFESAENYRTHIKEIHQGIDRQMIKCDKCGMEFKASQAAKRHEETQCGAIKPHQCDQCPMAFYTKYNLAEHKKIHTGEKKFCCSYCGKSFMNKGRLVIHERSHTGEKPYKCDVCGKCFAHRESIVTHSSIHTGVKLVVCKCCGSRFSCHSNLIKHRRTRPDTCGLSIYNSTKETKRNGISRIPPGLMPSEIKIVRASKVIKPNEEQKKPKVTSCPEDIKKPKVVRSRAKTKKPKSESEGEEVIVVRPRLGLRTRKPANLKEVDVSGSELFPKEFGSKNDCDDPSFEKLMLSDSSFGSKKPIIEPETTDKVLNDVPLKTEEEQNREDYFSEEQRKPTTSTVVQPRLGLRLKDDSRSESPLMDFDSDNDCDDPPFDNTMYSDDSSDSEKPLLKSECRDNLLFDIQLKTEEEQKEDNSFDESDHILSMFLAEANYDVKDELNSTEVKEESDEKKDDSILNSNINEDKHKNKIPTKRIRKRKDTTDNKNLGDSESPTKRTRKIKTDLVYDDTTDNTNLEDSERPLKRRQRSALRNKLKFFKKDRVYDCKFCVKVYHIRKPYEKHLRMQHQITENELQEMFEEEDHEIPENYILRCPICSKVYLMAKRLKTHITFHGADGSLIHKCPCYCNIYFRTKEEAMEHAKEKHKDILYCDICDKYSQTPESFKTHKKTHFETRKKVIRNLICDKCAKSFASRTSLNDHTRSNCGKDPLYQCELCDKKFSTAGILKTHSLLHKDDTPYACDTCGKTFKIKAQYKTHIKMKHTDNKPFQCSLCPKAYPYRESLLTHMTVHTGLKRYACNGCSKRFTCISNLQAHRKVYADTCGVHPLNSKPSTYLGVQKGMLLMGSKPTF